MPTTSSASTCTRCPTTASTRRSAAPPWRPSRAATPPHRWRTLRQTAFMGTTLRGLLLEAYAFGTIGAVMLWARHRLLHRRRGAAGAHPARSRHSGTRTGPPPRSGSSRSSSGLRRPATVSLSRNGKELRFAARMTKAPGPRAERRGPPSHPERAPTLGNQGGRRALRGRLPTIKAWLQEHGSSQAHRAASAANGRSRRSTAETASSVPPATRAAWTTSPPGTARDQFLPLQLDVTDRAPTSRRSGRPTTTSASSTSSSITPATGTSARSRN